MLGVVVKKTRELGYGNKCSIRRETPHEVEQHNLRHVWGINQSTSMLWFPGQSLFGQLNTIPVFMADSLYNFNYPLHKSNLSVIFHANLRPSVPIF